MRIRNLLFYMNKFNETKKFKKPKSRYFPEVCRIVHAV